MRLERITPTERDWAAMDAFEDRVVYQTREWISFVSRTQRAEPIVAEVKDGAATVGYFTGLMVRRYGVPILGSPGPGWSTWYMGFNLREAVPRSEAVKALPAFAFGALRCVQAELLDRHLSLHAVSAASLPHSVKIRYEVDLRRTEDELWAGMTGACRRCVRKAERNGVVVEEASDPEFARDYYAQLRDVFAKQRLVPTYGVDRVQALMTAMQRTDHLLLLRARDAYGNCIATGVFPAMNRTAYFWGGASFREHQILRPNEAVMWYALRYWKARGIEALDLGGGGGHLDYKRKYGVRQVAIPFLEISKYSALRYLRSVAAGAYSGRQRLASRLSSARVTGSP